MRRPPGLLAAQLAIVVAGCLTVGAMGFVVLDAVAQAEREEGVNLRAALLAGTVERDVSDIERLLGPASTSPTLSGPALVETSNRLEDASRVADELHALIGSQESLELLGALFDARDFLGRYLAQPSGAALSAFRLRLEGLRLIAEGARPAFVARAEARGHYVLELASIARITTLAVTAVIATSVAGTTWSVGRRMSKALASSQEERARLVETAASLERRNHQFQALYQVLSEVSESLSMKYVVQTAAEKAADLVEADMVVVRGLHRDVLTVLGSEVRESVPATELADVALGAGYVGKAARRGNSICLPAIPPRGLAPGEGFAGANSGLIVPLIVGARVVGTIACWAIRPAAFDLDDQRMLELLASQVATALSAADIQETSEHEAHHDPLTGLPNRRQLAKDLRDQVGPALRRGDLVAIAMIDIDHFKRFNDEYGHRVGDITLQRVAEVLRSSIREEDAAYRYGGEEFTLVLPGLASDEAIRLVDRVRQAVARTTFTGEDLAPVGPVAISAGVSVGPRHARDAEDLIELADRALYRAKSEGRDRVVPFEPEDRRLAPGIMNLPLRAQRRREGDPRETDLRETG